MGNVVQYGVDVDSSYSTLAYIHSRLRVNVHQTQFDLPVEPSGHLVQLYERISGSYGVH